MFSRNLCAFVPFLNEIHKFCTWNQPSNTAMAVQVHPKRFFVNLMDDYPGGEVLIPKDVLQERLRSTLNNILTNQARVLTDCDGGLYVGLSGIAYMLYYLSTVPELAAKKQEYLKYSLGYMEVALQYSLQIGQKDPATAVGFLLGNAGVFATGAVLMNALGNEDKCASLVKRYATVADVCIPVNFLHRGGDEMFIGRAGYLCGLRVLKQALGIDVVSKQTVFAICSSIINSGREYARRVGSPSPLMYSYYDTEYLGAAHGLSAILQMLLCYPEFLRAQPDAENDVKGAVDFMLGLQQTNGNFPCAMDEVKRKRPEQEELIHWCHGAPGVVYLMAKAYLHWKDPRYLNACLKCGDLVWKRGILRKGPGICHGVAGNGYVFLLLYRLTEDKKHLYRALKFADYMFFEEFRREARTPDNPYSLFEGFAGTACYLADLLQPENAQFPLFNVF